MSDTSAVRVVRDVNRAEYVLDRILGEGGQGRVHAVSGRPLAVKLLRTGSPAQRDRLANEVARVRRLQLQNLPLARPLALLAAPHAGYVMELLQDMAPLARLIHPPKDAENVLPWYLETGGPRRRLRLLARLAEVLTELHGRGLCYGDLSPENVFVSEAVGAAEVWLIDCDNIHAGVARASVYTPGYAAPELQCGTQGADSLTDAWSFGALAFETLALLHPFDGDLVHEGDPDLEDAAFRGELPWVDDVADDRNAATARGLPRDLVLTPRLRDLARDCFGESRLDRQKRPGVAAWAERLHEAADQLLACKACGGGYLLNQKACPWCETPRPSFLLIDVRAVDPALDDAMTDPVTRKKKPFPLVARTVVQANSVTPLFERHLRTGAATGARFLVEVRLEGSKVVFTGSPDTTLELVSDRPMTLAGTTREVRLEGIARARLRPEKATGLHRVVEFRWHDSTRAS